MLLKNNLIDTTIKTYFLQNICLNFLNIKNYKVIKINIMLKQKLFLIKILYHKPNFKH